MSDTSRVLASPAEIELKIKGSRFIARARPVRTREDVAREVDAIRRRDHDASHHCTAFRIGADGEDWGFSDDREPSGTAGRPMLRHIEGHDLTDALVVVTRYFGGTKLGTGGLIRAYGDATRAVLEAAPVRSIVNRKEVRLSFDYSDTSPAMHVLQKFDTRILETSYGKRTTIRLGVRRSQHDEFVRAFVDALAGRGEIGSVNTS